MNWVEITTKIGCKNMCVYCPQNTLLKNYKDDKKNMTLEDFKLFLNNVDRKTTQIHFSGFSESFLNEETPDMMIYANKNGYEIVLYTTLIGFNESIAIKLKNENVKFKLVRFHRFEGVGFDENEFNKNSNIFYNSKLTENIGVIPVSKSYGNVVSRAGNVYETITKNGTIYCNENRYYKNVLLPNGDLYLCCCDWSLKHKIGNLKDFHYDSSVFNNERESIINLCKSEKNEVLCRKCELAH